MKSIGGAVKILIPIESLAVHPYLEEVTLKPILPANAVDGIVTTGLATVVDDK